MNTAILLPQAPKQMGLHVWTPRTWVRLQFRKDFLEETMMYLGCTGCLGPFGKLRGVLNYQNCCPQLSRTTVLWCYGRVVSVDVHTCVSMCIFLSERKRLPQTFFLLGVLQMVSHQFIIKNMGLLFGWMHPKLESLPGIWQVYCCLGPF